MGRGRFQPYDPYLAAKRRLAKILGMLGSSHAGDREAAARQIESIRQKLNLSWQEIFELWGL